MDKKVATHLKNFGVDYPAQHLETFEKQQKNKYKRKEIELPSGKVVKLQGNEPFTLLNELLIKYDESEIIMGNKNMPEIWYDFENKKHRYFPDFYIPKENLIIEVKSEYTLQKQWDKNQAKFQAVKDAGFNFRLEVR